MCCFSKTIHFQDVFGKSQETFDTCNDCNRQLRWREVRDIRAAQHDIILIHPKKVRTVCYAAAAEQQGYKLPRCQSQQQHPFEPQPQQRFSSGSFPA